MKKFLTTIGMAALLAMTTHAQDTVTTHPDGTTTTNAPITATPRTFTSQASLLIGSLTTVSNYVVDVGFGHSVSGTGRGLMFASVEYNFNNYAGLLAGYDYLWGNGGHELNSVRGGLTLQMPTTPLASLGYTNITATPFVFDCVATPHGGSTVGNVLGGGLDVNITQWKKIYIHGGIIYETRTGDGDFNGNYLAGYLAASTAF